MLRDSFGRLSFVVNGRYLCRTLLIRLNEMGLLRRLTRLAEHFVAKTARGRVLRGTSANAFGSAVTAFIQLLHIPILTHAWGVEQYGLWLMLIAAPTYIALADFGIAEAATVEMTRRLSSNDHSGALETLHSLFAFMGTILLAVASLAVGLVYLLVLRSGSEFAGLSADRTFIATIAIICYGTTVVFSQTIKIVLKSSHKVATDSMHSGLAFLFEGLLLVGFVLAGADLASAAIVFAATRIGTTVALFALTLWLEPWVKLSLKAASWAHIQSLMRPSIAALSLTISGAMTVQGSLLVLGALAGPAVVAVFGATRTLTRIPLQIAGFVLRPTLPELTRAQANGDKNLTKRLIRLNVVAALVVSLPFVIVLTLFGPDLLYFVSGGTLQNSGILFLILSLVMMFNAVWKGAASPLVATNRHSLFAYWYFGLAIAAIVAAFLVPGDPVYVIGIGLCFVEAVVLGIVVYHVLSKRFA